MPVSASVLTLVAVLTLALFLCSLNFFLWYIRREDKTPFWLAAWLALSAVFVFCRLMQFASLDSRFYPLLPRILLTANYGLAWLGYELANSFIGYHPSRRERTFVMLSIAALILLLFTTNLIGTNQAVMRNTLGGSEFHSVLVGPLFLPASFLILSLEVIPIIRLVRAPRPHKRENFLMAAGYLFVILFSLNDFIATALNITWIRASDYSYLPLAIFFSYIQVMRFGRVYRDLDGIVRERTFELSQANQSLRVEILEHQQAEEKINHHAAELTALYETTHDLVIERDLSRLLNAIVERAVGLVGASGGGLYLCDPEKRQVRCVVSYNTSRDYTGVVLKYGEGSAGLVAETGSSLLVEDYRTWAGRAPVYEEDRPFISLISVPMCWQESTIGVIHVLDNTRPFAFTQEDMQMVTLFADQAAIAIQNARLYEETQKRLREMEGIAQVSAAIGRTLELEPLLENVLQAAIHAVPEAVRGSILLVDEDQNLCIRAVWGYADPRVRNYVFPLDSGYASAAFRERRAMVVSDVRADPKIRYDGDIPEMRSGGSAIVAPLIIKDLAMGVIAIDTPLTANAFHEDDLHLMEALATPAALAIENARLFEYTQRRLAELEILQTIATELRIAQTLDEALPIILDLLIKLLHVGAASLELLYPSNGEIVTELARGAWSPVTGMRTPVGAGVSGRVIATGQPYISIDVFADGLMVRPDLANGLNSVACVPIAAQHRPIGALWVGRQSQTTFTREEVKLITALGEMVGNTIQRMKLHEQTERQAEEITSAYDLTLEGWAKALELRDKETEGHSRRVTDLTLQLARKLGVPEAELVSIRRGVLLHDIGKLGIPDQVLKKAGPLSEEEWVEMRKHPQYAYDLISPITYLHASLDVIYAHHERWDGSGYPRGLCMEQIPLAARIFAIVDVYDALSSDRPYRSAWPKQKVLDYLCQQSGKQFDPKIVDAFLQMIP